MGFLKRREVLCVIFYLISHIEFGATKIHSERPVDYERRDRNQSQLDAVHRVEELLRSELEATGGGDYTNEWAVYIPEGHEVATAVANDLGFVNTGQVGSLSGYYLLKKSDHRKRSKRHAERHTRALADDIRVEWAEQQQHKKRVKRDLIDKRDEPRAYRSAHYDDAFWMNQWYLYDSRSSTDLPKMDLHVIPAWAKNFTGAGVVVTILDDGIEHNHTDLAGNYDPLASYDFNGDDYDPFPRYEITNENKHGTRCAGEVAMLANNGICGVGVAYNSRIGGIRLLDGRITDSLEARALNFNNDHIDIFSASWGPADDGTVMEQPGRLVNAALESGVTKGRDGKGVIYVWASGNGGVLDDNCACDGYAASIYTLTVSSATQHTKSPWYAEHCPSTMATTYSSGTHSEQQIVSTDLHNECTNAHSGTSASAPLAAGIFALALQANPDLTWRDLQHLVAWTSEYAPLRQNPGWQKNGAGYWVNNRFGFGLLNAAALVNAADRSTFHRVPDKTICMTTVSPPQQLLPRYMKSGDVVTVEFLTDGCRGGDNEVNYLEHVILTLDMLHTRRGNIHVYLTSPSGTVTQLLAPRREDISRAGFDYWPFVSVHNWGENSAGKWNLAIVDKFTGFDEGLIKSVSLTLHGTKFLPHHVKIAGGQRKYNMEYNKVFNTRKTSDVYSEAQIGNRHNSYMDELLKKVLS